MVAPDRSALFARLVAHYGAEIDRRGWVHVTCPACGKEGTKKDVHFSFSLDRGAKCFSCGYGANLEQLAADAGLTDDQPAPPPPVRQPEPPKHYGWMDELPVYLQKYLDHPWRFESWESYRGLSPELVQRYQLGVGKFPPFSSQCDHYRLMVPMLQNGVPVAFRGRISGGSVCQHPKWLTTAMAGRGPLLDGGAVLLPEKDRAMVAQYNLTDAPGEPFCRDRVLVIVENPVDRRLMASAGLCAVATLGVTIWSADWTALLKQARPKLALIMFDHDLPGNGAGSEAEYKRMAEVWNQAHKTPPPMSNGLKLANLLNEAGVPAQAFRWPATAPIKADPGWLMGKVGLSRIGDICHL